MGAPLRGNEGPSVRVGVVPYHDDLADDGLFDPASPLNRDDTNYMWRSLRAMARERDVAVRTLDRTTSPDAIVSTDRILETPSAPWLAYVSEPPVTRPDLYRRFDEIRSRAARVFTHSPRLAASGSNVRLFSIPQHFPKQAIESSPARDGGLLAMVNANKGATSWRRENYLRRLRVAAWLARRDAIDVYGTGWEETITVYSPWTGSVRRRWKGPVESKHETLARYDFCLAFENALYPGYISEKVFDPMSVGCIPIYLGAPEIAEVLPPATYLDYRHLGSPARMLRAIQSMSETEKEQRRAAMRDYLASGAFLERFGVTAWASQLLDEIESVLHERRRSHSRDPRDPIS